MTTTNAYATPLQLANDLGISDANDDARIDIALNSASRQIDGHCGRPHGFWQDSTVVDRKYHAVDGRELFVPDDISTVTGLVVKIDSNDDGLFATTLTINTHFIVLPLNAALDVPVHPYDRIVMVDGLYTFPMSSTLRPGVQISAKFGWPTTYPSDVNKACLIQARQLFKQVDATFGAFALGVDGQPMRVPRMDPMAAALLEPFRRVEV